MGSFIDCHAHLLLGGRTLTQLDLSGASSRDAFESAIAAEHARLPRGRWLEAHGWDEGRWGGELPTRRWLRAAGTRPAIAFRMDHHACVVNDAVLEMIAGAAVPDGGEAPVDERGDRTGLLREQAAWSLAVPLVPPPDAAAKREFLRAACARAAAHGLEAVCSMEFLDDVLEVFEPLRNELPIRIAVTLLDRGDPFDPTMAHRVRSDARLWVNGFKSFADGTLGSRTARMLEDYDDAPGRRGTLLERAADGTLGEWARAVIDAGFSPSIHAIGDEALRTVLDAIEPVDPERVTRFEHAQTIHPDDLPRLRGRLVSMQPLHRAFDRGPALSRLGRRRMDRFFPFGALLDHGAHLGFGSDWPVVDLDPARGIDEASCPRAAGSVEPGRMDGPEWSSIPRERAIHACTAGAERFLARPARPTRARSAPSEARR